MGYAKIQPTSTTPLDVIEEMGNIMDKWAKLKSLDEESVPGCFGEFGNPVEAWLNEDMNCEQCFWGETCKRASGTRGFAVVNFCPGCMTELFTVERELEIGEAIKERYGDWDLLKKLFGDSGVKAFGVFDPGHGTEALLFEGRIHFYPVCDACMHRMGSTEFTEKCERNIVLARRYGRKVKG